MTTCFARALIVLGLLAGAGFAYVLQWPVLTDKPSITELTCDDGVAMGYRPTLYFSWETQHATSVRAESGYLDEQDEFRPGGWHVSSDLPAQGSGSFFMRINNYAVRVCITEPASVTNPICAVCAPTFGAE